MQSLTRILVVIGLCAPVAVGQESTAKKASTLAVLEGAVTYPDKVIPKARVGDNSGAKRDLLTVDRKSKGLQYVMIYLEPEVATDDQRPAPKGSERVAAQEPKKKAAKPPTIDQLNHRFVPHLLAITDGQRVKFTNGDDANHNVRAVSLQPKNNFNIFTGAGGAYEHQFTADRKSRPVKLSCDIHPWMSAWIYVFKHRRFAVTDKKGRYRITGLAPGEYRFQARQPDVGYLHSRKVMLKAGETLKVDLAIRPKDIKAP